MKTLFVLVFSLLGSMASAYDTAVTHYCSAIDSEQRIYTGMSSSQNGAIRSAMRECDRRSFDPTSCEITNCSVWN